MAEKDESIGRYGKDGPRDAGKYQDKVEESIGKYGDNVDGSLSDISNKVNEKDFDSVVETIGKYERGVARRVAGNLGFMAEENPEGVSKAAEALGDEKVVDIISKYEENFAEDVAWGLGWVATKNPKAVSKAAETIGKYKGDVAGKYARELGGIVIGNLDKLNKEIEKEIEKYQKE